MKNINPAQDGIDAAREDVKKREFLNKLCDEFKAFVLDSAADHSDQYDDHLEFIGDAMDVFTNLKSEGE